MKLKVKNVIMRKISLKKSKLKYVITNNMEMKLHIHVDLCSIPFVYDDGLLAWMNSEMDITIEKIRLQL